MECIILLFEYIDIRAYMVDSVRGILGDPCSERALLESSPRELNLACYFFADAGGPGFLNRAASMSAFN